MMKVKIYLILLEIKLPAKKPPSNCDRFIPNRKKSRFDIAFTSVHGNLQDPLLDDSSKTDSNSLNFIEVYKKIVLGINKTPMKQTSILTEKFQNNNILNFSEKKMESDLFDNNNQTSFPFDSNIFNNQSDFYRKIPKLPYKVLDAPSLQDDFYLNLVDWGQSNLLSVGLAYCVYLWSAATSKVTKLCECIEPITSVSWDLSGEILGVGNNIGDVMFWDPNKLKKIRTLKNHNGRVGVLAWNSSNFVASGSRDKSIIGIDKRSPLPYVMKWNSHKQEVCGLKWSFDSEQLASGGNDNKLMVWSSRKGGDKPLCKWGCHKAAVKALAWSPHQHGLLLSGGGTADRSIRFWNTLKNYMISSIDTGSQVCNLIFSKNVNEFVSTHGYSNNHVCIWNYPSKEKIATLAGHTCRVLYVAISPEGETIVTGAGDETLRFWNAFPPKKNNEKPAKLQESPLTLDFYQCR